MKSNAFDPNRTTLKLISYLQESPEPKNKKILKTEISEPSLKRGPTLRGSLEPPVHDLLVPHKSKIIRMLQEDIKTEFNQRQYSHALRGRLWADPSEPLSIGEKNKMRMRAYQRQNENRVSKAQDFITEQKQQNYYNPASKVDAAVQ